MLAPWASIVSATAIANVVKCRPERNRNPEPDEVAA
jgi:uracil-DNA glycosylase